jgi:hypothetical protein
MGVRMMGGSAASRSVDYFRIPVQILSHLINSKLADEQQPTLLRYVA